MPNKMVGRFALLVGGGFFGIGLVELGARLIAPNDAADLLFNASDASPMNLYIVDSTTRVTTAPNIDTTIESLDYNVRIRTNELGLRGPKLESVGANIEHWIALGDSFTMSVQVNEEESFAGLLSAKTGAQVWNAGVDGYSTWQSTLRLKQVAEQLKIKRVLLTFFTGNDFQDNERFLAMQRSPLPAAAGTPIPRPVVSPMDKWLLQHSYIYAHYRIYNKIQSLGTKNDFSKGNWQDELRLFSLDGQKRRQQLRQSTTQALRELQQFTRRHQMDLMVAVAPPAFVIHPERLDATFTLVDLDPTRADVNAPQNEVLNILEDLKIASCDLTSTLLDVPNPYFTFDGHWTPDGHAAVSQAIATCWSL